MDRLIGLDHLTDEIAAVMRERGINRDEAVIVVAMRHGDLVDDVLIVGSQSEEQKRRRRMTLGEVMAELGELDELREVDGSASSLPDGPRRRMAG
jgi:hypothetical protein